MLKRTKTRLDWLYFIFLLLAAVSCAGLGYVAYFLPKSEVKHAQTEASVDDIRNMLAASHAAPWRSCGLQPERDLAGMQRAGLMISNQDLKMLQYSIDDCRTRLLSIKEQYRAAERQTAAFTTSPDSR